MCIAGTTLLVGDAPKRMIPNYSGQVDSEKLLMILFMEKWDDSFCLGKVV